MSFVSLFKQTKGRDRHEWSDFGTNRSKALELCLESMLAQRGLRLGEGLDQGYVARAAKEYIDSLADRVDASVLNRPVSSLELSVRARRALQLLAVQSIGELAARTEAELMGVKNFGQNSLDEIKRKLADLGLGLRELE